MSENKLNDEEGRVASLLRYENLDGAVDNGFAQITKLVQAVLDMPVAAILLLDRDRQIVKSAEGLSPEDLAPAASFAAATIASQQPLVITDAAGDGRFARNALVTGAPHIRSYIGVPLTSPDGYNIGVLCAFGTAPRRFDAQQVTILQSFAALAIEQMELSQVGGRDAMTGALTRRGFYQEVEREFVRARRYERPTSLLFFDIDHFHKINDAFGYEAGDEALSALAAKCMEVSRASDSFGRIAGQEFAFLLPETNAAEAIQCAERMREVIEKLRFRTASGVLSVTASFGIASLAPGIVTAAQWFAETDVALYEAKRLGRNCCVLATSPKLSEVRQDGVGTIEAAAATLIH